MGQTPTGKAQPSKNQTKSGTMLDFPIEYKAEDSIIVFIRDKKEILIGKAQVKYQNIVLTAEYIEIDFDKNEVYATGRIDSTGQMSGFPVFKEGSDEFEARSMKYNFNTKKGLIQDVVTEQDGGFLHSHTTKKHNNNVIDLKGGKYTTCDHEHPHFYIAMTKARIIANEKIVSGPLYLVIEDIPTPIAIPFGYFPFTKEQTSGLVIPKIGESRARGFYLTDGGYYWAGNDYFDFKITGSIYSKGSWDLKMNSNYNVRYKFNGRFSAQIEKIYVGEVGSSDEDIRNAYALIWSHNQDPKANPNHRFGANVNLRSTSSNIYSTNINNYIENTINSDISYQQTFAGTPFSLALNAKHSVSTRDTMVTLTLPVATFTMSQQTPFARKERVGKQKWYETIGITYRSNAENRGKMHERDFLTEKMIDKFQYGLKHTVETKASLKLFKHINITPNANYTERWYFDRIQKSLVSGTSSDSTLVDPPIRDTVVTDTTNGFYRVWDYNTSVSMNTKIYGMYKFHPSLPIEAIRMVHDPSIGISYHPDFGDPRYNYYANDSIDALNYNRYSNGIYGSAPIGQSQSINFSLSNNIEMKIRTPKDTANNTKKVTIFDNIGFRTSYNAAADSMNWTPLTFGARTKLLSFLNFDFTGSMDWYSIDNVTQKRVNQFEFNSSGKLGRLTSANLNVSFNINSQTFSGGDKKRSTLDPMDYNYYYTYFDIPWSINIRYTYGYSKAISTKSVIQNINLDGDFSVTKKWKITYSTGYDLEKRDLVGTTNFGITRDLHCWIMSFNWVPFGERQSYFFTIKVKSSILQDLKYDKRKYHYDQIQ